MTDSAQAALAEVLAIPGFPPNRRNGKFKEEKKKKKKKSSRKPKTDASKPTRDFEGLFYEDRNPHESDGDSDDARRALIDDLAHQEPDSDDDEVSQIVKKKKPEPAPLAPGDLADQLVPESLMSVSVLSFRGFHKFVPWNIFTKIVISKS